VSDRVVLTLVVLAVPGAWAGTGYVVFNTSPDELADRLAFFALFYVALFATFSLASHILSFRLFTSKYYRGNVSRSLEQGGLWGTFVLVATMLQVTRTLSLLSTVLLIGALAVAQFVVLIRR